MSSILPSLINSQEKCKFINTVQNRYRMKDIFPVSWNIGWSLCLFLFDILFLMWSVLFLLFWMKRQCRQPCLCGWETSDDIWYPISLFWGWLISLFSVSRYYRLCMFIQRVCIHYRCLEVVELEWNAYQVVSLHAWMWCLFLLLFTWLSSVRYGARCVLLKQTAAMVLAVKKKKAIT